MADDIGGGLGMMRLIASGAPLAGQDALEKMASSPVLDPANKWVHAAAGFLAPNPSRAFSGAAANALEGYAKSQDTEAELRARYAPIVAQALMNRQMMQFSMFEKQHQLASEYQSALVNALAPLTTTGSITDDDVRTHIGPLVRSNIVPGDFANQFLGGIPNDPVARSAYIRRSMLSQQKPGELSTSLTPKVEVSDTGGAKTPINTNANAGPVGALPGAVPNTLKPEDYLTTTIETKNGPFIFSKISGKSAPAGSPEGLAIAAEARAAAPSAAAQPPGPGAPMPSRPAPSAAMPTPGAGAPSVSAVVDPAKQASDTKLGEAYGTYEDTVNKGVEQMSGLMQRVGEQAKAIKEFRPGMTGEARLKVASFVKDSLIGLGLPASQATAVSNGIAGGNMASMQEFKKLANQGAMDALRAAAGPGQRITQAEFAVFAKNNPNIEMDADAIEKIQNFITTQYRKAIAEQGFLAQSRQAGVPVQDIPAAWARKAEELGYVVPQETQGTAKGSVLKPEVNRVGVSKSGKKIILRNGVWEYQ